MVKATRAIAWVPESSSLTSFEKPGRYGGRGLTNTGCRAAGGRSCRGYAPILFNAVWVANYKLTAINKAWILSVVNRNSLDLWGFVPTYVYSCSNEITQYSIILAQVSLDVAICQFVQSWMVSGAAVVGGSTIYWAAMRLASTVRPRANENIMMKAVWASEFCWLWMILYWNTTSLFAGKTSSR